MNLYKIRRAAPDDVNKIIEVYNSNKEFLINHLGLESVNSSFIYNEISKMDSAGFQSSVVTDAQTGSVIGVIDFKPDTYVYLSLIMIDSKFHGKGVGTIVYRIFENDMLKSGSHSIRIDVVNDYDDNVVEFWKKQGFISHEEVQLQWGRKKSKALTMIKDLHFSAVLSDTTTQIGSNEQATKIHNICK